MQTAENATGRTAGMNPKQGEACSYTEGPLLILAGAGSGKTRVITHRVAYLIREKGVKPYNILAITFTNKAAKEMRERVDRLVEENADQIWVSTFHSMCVRILRRHYDKIGGSNNFTIYDTDDQKAVLKEVIKTLQLDDKMYPIRKMLASISGAKEEFLSPGEYEDQNAGNYYFQNVAKVYREYEKRMRKNNALDFDDLINKTIWLFMQEPDVLEYYQNRFRYIMVDEYQDTNHSQFVLVKQLAAKHRNLCVVGDDDQSIYKFRGADIHNILNFEDEYPDAKVVKLEQNYRSTANILNAANAVIANNVGRKEKSLWTKNPEGEKLVFTRYGTDRDEASGTVKRMLELRMKKIPFADMAVLYRTNAQSRSMEEQLVREGIPYQIVGGTNFYDRREIRDMVGYLKCLSNTLDDQSLSRIINVPRRGIGDSTVEKLQAYADSHELSLYGALLQADSIPEVKRAAAKLREFSGLMEHFRVLSRDGDLGMLYREILEKTGYRIALERENTDESRGRLENLEELENKIVDFQRQNPDAGLLELLEEISLVADAVEDDGSSDRVTLMTLHSAKGLEFDVVFMVGMEEELFPSKMSIDSDDPDAVEEERRLCYVGITRARKRLFLSAAACRMMRGNSTYPQISRYIDEIPEDLMIREGTRDRGDAPFSGTDAVERSRAGNQGVSYADMFRSYGEMMAKRREAKKEAERTGSGKTISERSGSERSGSERSDKMNKKSPGFVPDYQVGDTVRHIKFGKGVVIALKPENGDYEVTVRFDTAGEKQLFASLAKLRLA